MSALTLDTRLAQVFARLIQETVSELKDDICAGQIGPDRYQNLCGELRGLIRSLEIIKEAQAKIEGKEPR